MVTFNDIFYWFKKKYVQYRPCIIFYRSQCHGLNFPHLWSSAKRIVEKYIICPICSYFKRWLVPLRKRYYYTIFVPLPVPSTVLHAQILLYSLVPENIEWCREDQAFLQSYDSAPRPPPSFPAASYLSFSIFLCVAGRSYRRERGGGSGC
jgi:hypothetical protein